MTAGMAFEAMNDAVAHNADLIVVLNDNDMSISCSTGGFAKHLAAIWEKGHLVNIDAEGQAYVHRIRSGPIIHACISRLPMQLITYLKRLALIILVPLMAMMSISLLMCSMPSKNAKGHV